MEGEPPNLPEDTASEEIVDGTRNVWELEYRVECDWVKKGPGKLTPFLVRKKSPKRASNRYLLGLKSAILDKGQHVIFPKKEASRKFTF